MGKKSDINLPFSFYMCAESWLENLVSSPLVVNGILNSDHQSSYLEVVLGQT